MTIRSYTLYETQLLPFACGRVLVLVAGMFSSLTLLHPRADPDAAAVLVRAGANQATQQQLYEALCGAAWQTAEWFALEQTQPSAVERPLPLCVWRHPYSQRSNAQHAPSTVLDWAHGLAARTAAELRMQSHHTAADAIDNAKYDSLVSVLYAAGGTLQPHVDQGLHGYGLALSLGSTATFDWGGTAVELESGDVVFGDFGRVRHAVTATHCAEDEGTPVWWRNAVRFGRTRCSLQLRDRAWAARPHPTEPGKMIRRTVRKRTAQ